MGRRSKASLKESAARTIQSIWKGYRQRKLYGDMVKKSRHRRRVFSELLATEETYMGNLDTLINVFYEPMKALAVKEDAMVTTVQVKTIFQGIEMVRSYNAALLEQLRKAEREWHPNSLIGPIFVEFAPFLKAYTTYVGGYTDAVQTLGECQQVPEFKEWLTAAFERTSDNVVDLPTYLITPVQRIPRYKLLLTDLLKHTWETHPDIENLRESVELVSATATTVNRKKQESENVQKCIAVQSSLFGRKLENVSLVSAHRRFVREGMLSEVSVTGGKSRPFWFVLFNDLLVRAKMPQTLKRRETKAMFEFMSKHRLVDGVVISVGGNQLVNSFQVKLDSLDVVLQAESPEDKNEWMDAIKLAVDTVDEQSRLKDSAKTKVASQRAQGGMAAIADRYKMIREQTTGPAAQAAASPAAASPAPEPGMRKFASLRRGPMASSASPSPASPIVTPSPAAGQATPEPALRKFASLKRGGMASPLATSSPSLPQSSLAFGRQSAPKPALKGLADEFESADNTWDFGDPDEKKKKKKKKVKEGNNDEDVNEVKEDVNEVNEDVNEVEEDVDKKKKKKKKEKDVKEEEVQDEDADEERDDDEVQENEDDEKKKKKKKKKRKQSEDESDDSSDKKNERSTSDKKKKKKKSG